MSVEYKLEPCPFCGADAVLEEVENAVGPTGSVCFSVGCNSRDEESCMGYQSLTTFSRRGDAIKAWNTRISPEDRKRSDEPDGKKAERLLMEACDFIAATLPKDIEPRAWKHLLIYAPKDKSDAPV